MKRRLVRQISFVSAAQYLAEALFLLRGFVLAHALGPTVFGTWNAMRLMLVFSQYLHIGSRHGMIQLAPYAEGCGRQDTAILYRRAAAGINLCGTLIMVLAMLTVLWQWGPSGETGHWWLIFTAIIVADNLFDFQQSLLASQARFGLKSSALIAFAVLSTGLGIWTLSFGLGGFLIALGLSYLIPLFGSAMLGPRLPRPTLRREAVYKLLRVGFPLMAAQGLQVLLWNIDKLLIWLMAGSKALGVYAIQAYFTNALLLAPASLAQVLHPHLARLHGQERTSTRMQPYLEEGAVLLAYLACPLIGLCYLALHLPVRWLLPAYSEAIAPGQIMVLASFMSIIALVPSTVLIALGRHNRLLAIRGLAVAVSAIGIAFALSSGYGFTATALASALGFLVYAVLAIESALRAAELSSRQARRFRLRLFLPFIALLLLLAGVTYAIPPATASLAEDLISTSIQCAIVVALLSTGAVWIFRQTRLIGSKRQIPGVSPG